MPNIFVLGILLASVVWAPTVQCEDSPNLSATSRATVQNEVD
jgi:hypothetical protein